MRRRRPWRWDAVLKIGGSLGRGGSLPRLLAGVARVARRRRLLVVPGGGLFADLVRAERARHRLDEPTAHRMALRAMDQYGLLIAELCPGAQAVDDLAAARRVASGGHAPVLLASAIVERERGLERSFRLTSDSIAAFLARRVGADRLILLKACDEEPGPVARARLRRLARRGVVDPLFPALAPLRAETWIVSGRTAAWERVVSQVATTDEAPLSRARGLRGARRGRRGAARGPGGHRGPRRRARRARR
jgi:aspartokinase-like uncharacterized kinase